MPENYFYVNGEILENLNAKYEEWAAKDDNPPTYRFAGFAVERPAPTDSILRFFPLYEPVSGNTKSVVFRPAVEAGECPNPPGYLPPLDSWSDAFNVLEDDKSSGTDQEKPSNGSASEDAGSQPVNNQS